MAAKAKNGNGNSGHGNGPALHFEFIERRESDTYMMDVRVLEMLDVYPQYIEVSVQVLGEKAANIG